MKRTFLMSLLGLLLMPCLAGVTYQAESTITAEKQKPIKTVVFASVQGEKARIEIRESNNPAMGKGVWLVTKDAGKTMFMVNPKEKSYMAWDFAQLGALVSGMGNMFQMKFSNAKVEKLEEGPGDALLGKATTRYKHKTTYDLDMKILGMKQVQSVEMEQETWNTEGFSDQAMKAWLRSVPSLGIEGLDKLMTESMKTVKGIPLKSVSRTLTKQWDKNRTKVRAQSTTTSETLVTQLQDAAIEDGVFEIPSDYKLIQLPTAPAQNGAPPSLKDIFK